MISRNLLFPQLESVLQMLLNPWETFKVELCSIFTLHADFRTPLSQPDTNPSNCLHVSAHQLSIPLFLSFLKKKVISKQSLVVKVLGYGVTMLGFESHLYFILEQNDTYSSLYGMVHFYTNCLSILCSQCLLYSKNILIQLKIYIITLLWHI